MQEAMLHLVLILVSLASCWPMRVDPDPQSSLLAGAGSNHAPPVAGSHENPIQRVLRFGDSDSEIERGWSRFEDSGSESIGDLITDARISSGMMSESFLSYGDPSEPECLAEEGKWIPGRFLGSGSFGDVWEVHRAGDGQAFAYKQNHLGKGIEQIETEIEVMADLSEMYCSGVMLLEDDDPCEDDDSWSVFAGYIMPLMNGDLQNWAAHAGADDKVACGPRVARQAAAGLFCLHAAGWLHNDLRSANIFYGHNDKHGCPTNVAIADYGLAEKIDDQMPDQRLNDWCNFFVLMNHEFGYNPTKRDLPRGLPRGSCGQSFVLGNKQMICRIPEGCAPS